MDQGPEMRALREPAPAPYELLRRLVGTGERYLARRRQGPCAQQRVVLRRVSNHAEDYARKRKALLEEIRVLCRLNHPALPVLIDCFEDERGLHMVTSYTRGASLWKLGQLSAGLAARAVALALRALNALHQDGLAYMGIRPSALLLGAQGSLLFDDLAFARLVGDPPRALPLSRSVAPFFAPELIAGEAPSPRADLYAAGVTLFELLSPTPKAHSIDEALTRTVQGGPDLLRLHAAGAPDPLIRIIGCALAMAPERRFSTAVEMADALERWLLRAPQCGPDALNALVERHAPREALPRNRLSASRNKTQPHRLTPRSGTQIASPTRR